MAATNISQDRHVSIFLTHVNGYFDPVPYQVCDNSNFTEALNKTFDKRSLAELKAMRATYANSIRSHQVHIDAYAAAWKAFKNGQDVERAEFFAALHRQEYDSLVMAQHMFDTHNKAIIQLELNDPFADLDPGAAAVPGTVEPIAHLEPR